MRTRSPPPLSYALASSPLSCIQYVSTPLHISISQEGCPSPHRATSLRSNYSKVQMLTHHGSKAGLVAAGGAERNNKNRDNLRRSATYSG
ncbi:hypothetical protein RR48_05914 [Papilio machaon]|uniref:Uncharacterized protein n=1 Tax=Papilio machaon TaxID=76193 RepID=A0A0N0PE97_PAPMA|nr:hypothetical protein RR48_05914 [Papilio machaon]